MSSTAEGVGRREKAAVKVKVRLESRKLTVHGGMRGTFPFKNMEKLHVKGGQLCFTVGAESIVLSLGGTEAAQWADTIAASRSALSRELAITPKPLLEVQGISHEPANWAVLEETAYAAGAEGDLILARIDTPEALVTSLEQAAKQLARHIPIWIIYPALAHKPLRKS